MLELKELYDVIVVEQFSVAKAEPVEIPVNGDNIDNDYCVCSLKRLCDELGNHTRKKLPRNFPQGIGVVFKLLLQMNK